MQIRSPKAVKYPTKRSINPAKREQRSNSLLTLIVGVILIVLLSFGVAKFGVIDQLERQQQAEAAYERIHSIYLENLEKLSNYDEIKKEYQTFSRNWMNEKNSDIFVSVDRLLVLELVENHLMASGQLKSMNVQGNVLIARMSGMNLSQISVMLTDLQQKSFVKNAELGAASTEKETDMMLDFSIIITLQSEEAAS